MPTFLSAEGKREWKRIVKELEPLGLLTQLDRAPLALYCQAWEEFLAANKAVADLVLKGESGAGYIAPAVNIRSAAWKRVLTSAAEFGLTPASRSRVNVAQRPKASTGKERFFGA